MRCLFILGICGDISCSTPNMFRPILLVWISSTATSLHAPAVLAVGPQPGNAVYITNFYFRPLSHASAFLGHTLYVPPSGILLQDIPVWLRSPRKLLLSGNIWEQVSVTLRKSAKLSPMHQWLLPCTHVYGMWLVQPDWPRCSPRSEPICMWPIEVTTKGRNSVQVLYWTALSMETEQVSEHIR